VHFNRCLDRLPLRDAPVVIEPINSCLSKLDMSRAFVKEADGDQALSDLPERPVSSQPNFVTSRGMRLIDAELRRLEQACEQAKLADDKDTLARLQRDLRYWQQRKGSAKVVTPEVSPSKVRFGMTVALRFEDSDNERAFTLVGEDEAEPQAGLISWNSPVAQALLGREEGEAVEVQGSRAEIVGITGGS